MGKKKPLKQFAKKHLVKPDELNEQKKETSQTQHANYHVRVSNRKSFLQSDSKLQILHNILF